MRIIHRWVLTSVIFFAFTGITQAQSWRPLANQPSFSPETALLLTDGSVMVHAYDPVTAAGSRDWWRLKPDANGSYGNGTWSQLASMPEGYAPLYFASAVLRDGRVLVEGGEYNGNDPNAVWTNLGALYDPTTDTWTPVAPPKGWRYIGDAPSVVLPSGLFMLGSAVSTQQALFDPRTLTWTATGTGKADGNAEEGWTLLPDGQVLTVDVATQTKNSEIYNPRTGAWTSAGSTIVPLFDAGYEMGPAILRPDGSVFATGASGHTAIYYPQRDKEEREDDEAPSHKPGWQAGPDFPNLTGMGQLDIADGPAALLPNGHVLCAASPGEYQVPVHFFEFDGKQLTQMPDPPGAPSDSSFYSRLLLLPTGEVLFLDASNDVEIYSSSGSYKERWAPEIELSPERVRHGKTYEISGTQFNGLSQAVFYGDDVQAATNYPLVRIVNKATGHVFYARTHDHSTMAVATGDRLVSTHFDVPANVERGRSLLAVVANGIPSRAVHVTVE